MGLAACSSVASETETVSNKDKAIQLISSIETGDPGPIAYINPDQYIQHNLAISDGLAGFGAVMQMLPAGSAKADVKRVFQDGEYVILHTEYDFFGPKAGFDVFRFEQGKIVEHWDNLADVAPANSSGRTQFDGMTEVTDLDKTEANKAMVTDFVDSILIKGEMAKIGQFIGPEDQDYLQHNSGVADGLSGFGEAIKALTEAGLPMVYAENHKILGQGNFVLSISEGKFLNKHVAFYDLFRVENEMIIEHWDTIEEIPVKAEWKNTNGKFGFK
ncbi:nuclear transport factor 2 family protein [Vibrio sp. VB16]|uniref:nuclear transport factor 2 family protein n=1 Tax=Vibrio sp. VB16 TaxID=2785746 RepID=UPI003FCC4337